MKKTIVDIKAYLKCQTCKRRIETLSEEEALEDLEPHGWTNWKTANAIKCFDCATDYDDYETYYAGRIKKGYPTRVYMLIPDISGNSGRMIECYTEK